ncbi:hypothetical protein FRB95_009361 [Tulasnella sp. JGI-2019a]|nr:hypothetical protein FRB95_009361 [Tulasnella sp. JGI-2019a]
MQLIFSGADDQDVTVFIRKVQLQAFEQGYPRDDAYLADLAAASIEGAALRWFSEQEKGVQESWQKLRPAMLCRFNGTPRPVKTDNSAERLIHAAPHLSTVTADNFAATAWSWSERLKFGGIRIYKPEGGGIREICNNGGTQFGAVLWCQGAFLRPKASVSDTALIAAVNSFGRHGGLEGIDVYFVSRDNHLRSFRWPGWAETPLDISLNGICTDLNAECRTSPEEIVRTLSYTVDGTTHLRTETTKRDGVSRLEIAERSASSVRPDPDHRLKAALDQYDKDAVGRSLTDPGSPPKEWIPSGSPISVVAWLEGHRKVFVFISYSGKNVGYLLYDQEADAPGWQSKVFAVQI